MHSVQSLVSLAVASAFETELVVYVTERDFVRFHVISFIQISYVLLRAGILVLFELFNHFIICSAFGVSKEFFGVLLSNVGNRRILESHISNSFINWSTNLRFCINSEPLFQNMLKSTLLGYNI